MPEPLALDAPVPQQTSPFPKRPRRSFQIDPQQVVTSVLGRIKDVDQDLERGDWLEKRLNRIAKFRMWRGERKTYPWPGCSDVRLPLLMANELRANAGLSNVAMSLRPLLGANGSLAEYASMRHMANLESVYTYEGTHDIHSLILGQAVTGLNAFGG